MVGEPVNCSLCAPHSGDGFSVVEDFPTGETGMVVVGGVDIAVAEVGPSLAGALTASILEIVASPFGFAEGSPSSPSGILPSFLMSMWTSSPGMGFLIAAYHPPGGSIHPPEPI